MSAGLANGLLVSRVGPRPLVPAGMLAAAGAMFWLSQFDRVVDLHRRCAGPCSCSARGSG